MKILKSIALFCALFAWGFMNIAMYRNEHLIARAEETEDLLAKIPSLRKASASNPFEPRAPYELGKAYFNLALQDLSVETQAEADLRHSIEYLQCSIRLNPFSAFSHFQIGQSLLYLDTISVAKGEDPLENYRKAVSLAGYNSQIFLDVGKTCLMHWKELSEDDKSFALSVLKRILDSRDPHLAQIIFQAWEMNALDYEIMRNVLPEDPQVERAYAEFLAEKSLSLGERQAYLAKAEFLEFENAKRDSSLAENDLSYFRIEKASELFLSCLTALRKVRFYQDLTRETLINVEEFRKIRMSCWLNLAKCGIREGKSLKDVQGYLEEYLGLADRISSVNALEAYLREKGMIQETIMGNLDDPDIMAFQLGLYYKQNRYRDIVQVGRLFRQTLVIISGPKKDAYIKVLQVIGDSCQKIDLLYDAREFYKKALELDPSNLATLVRMLRNAERLNNETGIREAEENISKNASRKDLLYEVFLLQKGQIPSWQLLMDERARTLELHFQGISSVPFPLLSIVFNEKVIWEGYVDKETLEVPLQPKLGGNLLALTCLNRTASLDKLTYR